MSSISEIIRETLQVTDFLFSPLREQSKKNSADASSILVFWLSLLKTIIYQPHIDYDKEWDALINSYANFYLINRNMTFINHSSLITDNILSTLKSYNVYGKVPLLDSTTIIEETKLYINKIKELRDRTDGWYAPMKVPLPENYGTTLLDHITYYVDHPETRLQIRIDDKPGVETMLQITVPHDPRLNQICSVCNSTYPSMCLMRACDQCDTYIHVSCIESNSILCTQCAQVHTYSDDIFVQSPQRREADSNVYHHPILKIKKICWQMFDNISFD